jgi:hypothetical protein
MPIPIVLNGKSAALIFLLISVSWFISPVPVRALVNDHQITINSSKDVLNKRRALIRFIWGSAGFPKKKLPSMVTIDIPSPVSNLSNLRRVDEIHITMDAGQEGLAHHFIPVRKNNRLVILHQGHACHLNDNPAPEDAGGGMQRTINALLQDGYSVLGVYMPHMRPHDCTGHADIFDIETTGSPMKFFLEPVAVCLNYLKTRSSTDHFPRYTEFHMAGLSGGGWTTTVYAAIDRTIKFSFPVAGTIPLYLRPSGAVGDLEQKLDAFYRIAGYPDLYVMGSYGFGRKQVQILNRRDDCCFGEAQHDAEATGMSYVQAMRNYEAQVRQVMSTLGSGTFRLEIDEAAPGHMISHNTSINVILSELNYGRRSIGASTSTDAFFRGMNGHLWRHRSDGLEDTGFAMVGVPAVLQGIANDFDVFFRDPSNLLKHAYWTESGWAIEDMPGGVVITDPVATSWGTERFDVVALGEDYSLYHWWRSNGSIINLDQVGSSVRGLGPPALVTWGVNRLDIFFRGWDRAVYHMSSSGSAPWALHRLGGVILDFPSAVVTGGNTLRVYVRARSRRLWEVRQTNGGPWQWAPLSAATGSTETLLSGSPSASVQDDVVKVHVRTLTGNLSSFSLSGDRWGFSNHGGIITGSPTSTPDGAFVRGQRAGLWLFDATNWTPLGAVAD